MQDDKIGKLIQTQGRAEAIQDTQTEVKNSNLNNKLKKQSGETRVLENGYL